MKVHLWCFSLNFGVKSLKVVSGDIMILTIDIFDFTMLSHAETPVLESERSCSHGFSGTSEPFFFSWNPSFERSKTIRGAGLLFGLIASSIAAVVVKLSR